MSKRGQSKEKKPLRRVNPRAAGVDIGSATHWVAIDPSLSEQPVREFAAYTGDLQKLADWLLEHKIQTVAMEATGVYWIALFELLRERGLEVCLVDARATKQVAGRKSDISDCQWIQELHSYGLLKQAFIPEAQIATLRSYVRQRDRWVADAARAIQHMQQALELMNVKLTEVVSDITGTTGLAIIDSILAGERNAERLSELRDRRCSRSQEEIARALHGSWREEHLFALSQAHDYYRYLGERIAACDKQIAAAMAACASPEAPSSEPPNGGKRDSGAHPFGFDAHGHCYRMAAVDLTAIAGVGANTVLTVLSETGTDMSSWRSERAFGSWLGLAPNPRKSGGRVLRSATKPGAQRAATEEIGQAAYDERFRARRLRSLRRMATELGFSLVPTPADSGA